MRDAGCARAGCGAPARRRQGAAAPDPSASRPVPPRSAGIAPAPPREYTVTPAEQGQLCRSLPLCPSGRLSVRSGESEPLYLRRLVSSTFLLVTMVTMIIISYIYKGNNTRCKVICHLEVGRLGAGCCVSAPDGEGTGIGPLRTA